MLIRHADIRSGILLDVRIGQGRVTEIGEKLSRRDDETCLDAQGAGLLVGLHDHHMHLAAYAAALASVPCGPPHSAHTLAQALTRAAERSDGTGWLRGINYHESVAGDIDRHWLDAVVPDMPLRIQHRSGGLWIFNTQALKALGAWNAPSGADPLERIDDQLSGRLYHADAWLRSRMPASPRPSLTQASRELARYGVTGITDAGVNNTLDECRYLVAEQKNGHLLQNIMMMGTPQLDALQDTPMLRRGPTKLYLRESALPELGDFCAQIQRSRQAGRAVAIHCVTLVELLFALNALQDCGVYPGDRIEHASVAPPDVLELLAAQTLTVVTQPNFVHERGDTYLSDVDPADLPWLYRGKGFIQANIALAAGTDAPYGHADPWQAMAAAVTRRTSQGRLLNPAEALTPQEAIGLFTGPASSPGQLTPGIHIGAKADLCVLDRPWRQADEDLAAVTIQATIKDGQTIWLA